MSAPGGLALDILTHITNVHWAGGGTVFVYGEWLGNLLHYVSIKDLTSEPKRKAIALPEPPGRDLTTPGPLFSVVGSSYADVGTKDSSEPRFLICGSRTVPHEIDDGIGNMTGVVDSHALIYASDDGVEWNAVREQSEIIDDFDFLHQVGAVALVWDVDTKSFYYDQHYTEFHHTGLNTKSEDQIFSSAKGEAWGTVSDTETASDPEYVSDFPKTYCKQNDCLDERGQHVPDGVMFNGKPISVAADKLRTVSIKPTSPPLIQYDQGSVSYTPGQNTVEVKRAKEDGTGVEVSKMQIPGVGCVTCVAGANGIFMAGGFVSADDVESAGAVAISVDDGLTWQPVATTQNGVTTMVAAPLATSGKPTARRNARL